MSNGGPGEEQPYREGDTPDAPQEQEPAVVPETAFIAVKMPDGSIDVVTDLQGMFPAHRQPSMGEIRNMCMALAADGQAQITANFVSLHLTKAMQQMAVTRQMGDIQQQMNASKIIVPK